MNRSQRRAAVIRGPIAVGLLCAVLGLSACPVAAADAGDDDETSATSNHDGRGRGVPSVSAETDRSNARGRRDVLRDIAPPDDPWHPRPSPCRIVWPAWPIETPLPYTGNRNGIASTAAPVQTPVNALSGVAQTYQHASTVLSGEADAVPVPAPPAGGAPGVAATPSAPAASAASTALPPASAAPPAPARQPEPLAAPPNPSRGGLPALPPADLGRIAALALPGLAGIAALTALGGFLGYRQAKAGYVLRAAGTARFLQ